jgi:hypothetical protein
MPAASTKKAFVETILHMVYEHLDSMHVEADFLIFAKVRGHSDLYMRNTIYVFPHVK